MGACWAFMRDRINFFTYGFYPIDERWRVNTFFVLLAVGIGLDGCGSTRRVAELGAIYFFILMPIASVILLLGFPAASACGRRRYRR